MEGAEMADQEGSARIIDGAAIAAGMRRRVARQTGILAERHAIVPGLTVVLVGSNPASEIYVRTKLKHAAEAGIRSRDIRLPADVTQAALLDHIAPLNADESLDAILVQMPLPSHIDPHALTARVAPP